MLNVKAVGSDLTPVQQDEVMTDLAFFLDEFGSTHAVRAKLLEQESEIKRLRRLLSQETQQEEGAKNENLTLTLSSKAAQEDVDDIMVNLSFFLETFGSTWAVREKLEDQKQEIAALQRATQWVLDLGQRPSKSRESRGATRASAESGSGYFFDVKARRLDGDGQVTQKKAPDGVREDRDGGDIDSGDEYGADGGEMTGGSVNSEDMDIVMTSSQQEKTRQSDTTNFADQVVAKADVIVRNMEIKIIMPSLPGVNEYEMTGDQVDSAQKADHPTEVSVFGPVKAHDVATTSPDSAGHEHPQQEFGRCVQFPNEIMSVSNNCGHSDGTVIAYYKFLKMVSADSPASPIGKLCGNSGSSSENTQQENFNGYSLGGINRSENTSSKSIIIRQPGSSSWKFCRYPGCTKNVQAHGLCCRHGGYHICKAEGCTRRAITKHLCRLHGGGTKCRFEGCDKLIASGCKGYCCRHARATIGYRKCMVEGCQKRQQQDHCEEHSCEAELQQSLQPQHGDCSRSLRSSQNASCVPVWNQGARHTTCRMLGCLQWVKRDEDPSEYCSFHKAISASCEYHQTRVSTTPEIHPNNQCESNPPKTEGPSYQDS